MKTGENIKTRNTRKLLEYAENIFLKIFPRFPYYFRVFRVSLNLKKGNTPENVFPVNYSDFPDEAMEIREKFAHRRSNAHPLATDSVSPNQTGAVSLFWMPKLPSFPYMPRMSVFWHIPALPVLLSLYHTTMRPPWCVVIRLIEVPETLPVVTH